MKVAFYSTSGEDLFRLRLPIARHLQDAGYRIQFICPAGPFADQIEKAGFACLRFDDVGMLSPIGELSNGYRLGNLYSQEEPDIVHHFGLRAIVAGGTAARRSGLPWVVHSVPSLEHGTAQPVLLRPGLRSVLRWAMRDAEVTVQTAEDRQLLINKGCVRPERTHVLAGDVVDSEQITYVAEPDREPVAAFLGTSEQSIDLDTFVESARRTGTRAGIRFALVLPEADLDGDLRSRLEKWQAEGVVEWWPRSTPAASLARIHVVFVPSCRQYGLRSTILTAAAMGRPVVATDTPECRDLIRHDATGMIVPPHDASTLGSALEHLLTNGDLRREMGRNARTFIENEYAASLVAKHIMAVYQRLFERGREV